VGAGATIREDRGVTSETGQRQAAVFEAERPRLTRVAYQMLGSWAEAEDAVQDAWLRFAGSDDVREPAAFLTTVVARICLDVLRSARVRRETYVGPWLPEPLVARMPATEPGPDELAADHDQLGYALLVVLERLTPEQRVAFVLHDVFSVPFDEVAASLSTTPAAARQLASRARRALAGPGAPDDGPAAGAEGAGSSPDGPGVAAARSRPARERARLVSAFLAAVRTGDLAALMSVLAPDVTMIGDGGGAAPAGPRPIEGAVAAARFLLSLFTRPAGAVVVDVEPVLVNGERGLLWEARTTDGSPLPGPRGAAALTTVRVVMAFGIADGRITGIYDQVNPAKLARVPTIAQLRSGGSDGAAHGV
jgi:RNA polymerase sigma-70 factor (ECF subfamily)